MRRAWQAPAEDAIRVRAFEIYAGRGFASGSPEADWLQAEAELTHAAAADHA